MSLATSQTHGPFSVDQFIIGESPIVTGNGVTDGSVTKYQLLKLTDTGVTPTLGTVTDGDKLVIAAQASASGKSVPYFSACTFNHAVVTGWPVGLDTFEKRKNFFAGSMLIPQKLAN